MSLEQTLTAARDRALEMEASAHAEALDLERALKLARGTRNFWIGDDTDTPTLSTAVERLLRASPGGLLLQQIVDATGARRNRISGVLVKLQVRGVPVVNLGDGHTALWSIRNRSIRTARAKTFR